MQLDTAVTFTRALLAALRDSDATDQLLIGEEISSASRMPALVPLMEADEEGRAILRDRPRITSDTVDLAALRALPEDRLGRRFADHLDRHGLDLDALAVPVSRAKDATSRYLLERVRQTHDIWHTLLELGVAGHEEVLVHAFQWPQLRMPYSALVVSFGSAKHVGGEARWTVLRHSLLGAYRAGRDAAPLLPVYWERHWEERIDSIRARLGVRPASAW